MTSIEPMEPVDEEEGNLVDLEDVSESDHAHNSSKRIEDTNEDNVNQIVDLVEPPLTIPTFGSKGII